MTATYQAMRAYYAARAPYYDAVYLKPERREDIAFLSSHLPARFRNRSVLEVACGTGYWTQHIAPAASRLVATDITHEPMEFARLRPGTQDVQFFQVDAYALPADLGLFDAGFAGLWFSHVPIASRQAFLRGLHAQLAPGARVIFFDNNELQLLDFPLSESDSDGNTYQQRELRDGTMHRVLKNFPKEEELCKVFEPFALNMSYLCLENFWLMEYELG